MPLHILVVEDEPDGADVVRRMLNTVGITTQWVGSAELALDALEQTPDAFDAAILDMALPEMDGFELMQTIRSAPMFDNLPLIAITAFHTPELKVQALESGFDAYFAKPLDTTIFAQSIEKLLS